MNSYKLKIGSNLNSIFFVSSFYLMIIMTVINRNEFVAAIAFTWFPLYLLTGISFFYPRKFTYDKYAFLAVLVCLSALYSTAISDVVTLKNCNGIVSYTLCYAIISTCLLTQKDFGRIIKFYMWFCLVLCCILIFNFIFSIGLSEAHRVSIQYAGIRKDTNYLSPFIVPSFGILLFQGFRTGKIKYFIRASITFVALFWAGSRASFLTMLISALIFFLYFIFLSQSLSIHKKILYISLAFIAVGILYGIMSQSSIFSRTTDFSNYENNVRLIIWNYALEGFYRNPIFGSGSMSGSYFSKQHVRWVTHSCYVNLISAQGIVGAILILIFWIQYLRVSKENIIFMVVVLFSFFFPLMFIDGYEGANFWVPMMLCRFISDFCKRNTNIIDLIT